MGELVTCPFCLGLWVATAYGFSLAAFPRATRLAGTILTAVTAADTLQLGYARLQQVATEAG